MSSHTITNENLKIKELRSGNHSFGVGVRYFSYLWENWKRFGLFVGNIISNIFLTIFYFTVFALFAIPYKIIGHFKKPSVSNFEIPGKQINGFEDFQKEF